MICMLFCSVSFAEQDSSTAEEETSVTLEAGILPFYLEESGTKPFSPAFPVYYTDGMGKRVPDIRRFKDFLREKRFLL